MNKPVNTPEPVATVRAKLSNFAELAKKSCQSCFGRGILRVTTTKMEPSVGGKLKAFSRTADRPCGCALRRFAKKFRTDPEFRASLRPPAESAP